MKMNLAGNETVSVIEKLFLVAKVFHLLPQQQKVQTNQSKQNYVFFVKFRYFTYLFLFYSFIYFC